MLKPEGQIFFSIVAYHPVYDCLKNMSLDEKWSQLMSNVDTYLSIYHNSATPEKKLENFLKGAGFECHLCQIEKLSYTFPNFSYFWGKYFLLTYSQFN